MAKGKKTGGGSRKNKPNKSTARIKDIIDSVVDFRVVVRNLYALGKGLKVKKGKYTYTIPPDSRANQILLEYRFGKPAQPLAGDPENPIGIKIIRDDIA